MNDLLSNINSTVENNYLLIFISFFSCTLIAFSLKFIYEERSTSLSGKYHIASIIPLLSLATFLVILIVKSSLALSLGLVGALSIVRFRTPIKEPEELVYLFLAISNGIGFASGQIVITFSIFVLIFIIIWFVITKKNNLKGLDYNLVVQWTADKNDKNRKQIETIINKLKSTFLDINIVRLEKLEEGNSMVVVRVNMQDISQIDIFNNSLEEEFKNIKVSFYESKFLY
tara:strand:+ start:141 stop:827 length:687 start_codon:yes stop_codon:yes gene_type:complete